MVKVIDSHYLTITAIVTVSLLLLLVSFSSITSYQKVCMSSNFVSVLGGVSIDILRNHSSFQIRSSHRLCRYD